MIWQIQDSLYAEVRRYPHDRDFPRFDHFDFSFSKYFNKDVPKFKKLDAEYWNVNHDT